MSTFLELCQDVARESGTVSGTQPTTVVGQSGRLGKIVSWVVEAYRRIQTSRSAWRWLETEFEKTTIQGTARYTPSSWAITRFAGWMITGGDDEDGFSIYASTLGVSDESPLVFLDWPTFYKTQTRGVRDEAKPRFFSVSPANELCLSPTPDQAYVVRGRYRKGPQILEANEEAPEMPAQFHQGIVYSALMLLAEHDEGFGQGQYWNGRWQAIRSDLERDQLPIIRDASEALA